MRESLGPRRWLQLSLRSLLFLTLLVAAYFAGVATMMRRVERAERAVRDAQQETQHQAELTRLNELLVRQSLDQSLLEAQRLRALLARPGVLERLREEPRAPAYVIPKN
jgi:hypothetical protein